MKQKIPLLIFSLIVSVFITRAQNTNDVLLSPGEITYLENEWEAEIPEERIVTFKEYSIGVLFMPISLNMNEINYTLNDSNSPTTLVGEDLFNMGIGLAINADFNKSGKGLGMISYLAIIGGDDIKALDFFLAIKYDLRFGDPVKSRFEFSPLAGVGNLSFIEKQDDLALGNSYYFSGGLRITYRIVNNLFAGADIQSVPLIFNPESLLGLDNLATDVTIDYKFFAQLNLSLRYNLF